MLRGLLSDPTTTTTPPATSTTTGGGLVPGLTGSTTTTAPAAPTTSTSSLAPTTTAAPHATTTTVGHAATSPPPTSGGSLSNAISNDHGVVHQLFSDAGASSASAHTAQIYLDGPLKVVFILIIAFVLTRLVNRVSHRFVNGLRLVSPVVKATPRGAARIQTLTGAVTQILRSLIWLIALLEVLNEFSINLAPFVATATVVGAAVGFGAQTLVKDYLSGILLLAEDQYGVGDHIAIGSGSTQTAGTVESVNLRVTRLRGADGGIVYVPNGDIRTISNDTETDSQALVDILVPHGTDLEAAGRTVQAAVSEMAAEEAWAPEFAGEPFFAGVADAAHPDGIVLRVMTLTRPGQHLRLAREMRLRIIERLRDDGVAWGPSRRQDKKDAPAPPLDAAPPAGLTEPSPKAPPAQRAAPATKKASAKAAAKPAGKKAAAPRGADAVTKAVARKVIRKSD